MLEGDTVRQGPGPSDSGEQLIGRRYLVERILQTIHNNSLLLQGERGIGKSMLLRHLDWRIREQRAAGEPLLCPVLIDLWRIPEERFFQHLGEELGRGLRRLGIASGTHDVPGTMVSENGYRSLIASLRRLLGGSRRHGTRLKIVLLIDEIDLLNDYDPRINQRLRSLFMKSFAESMVAVVAGERISKQWSCASSPWYNFFEEIEVGPLTSTETEELLRRHLPDPLQVPESVAGRLYQLTGGRPEQLCQCCQTLSERLHLQGRHNLTLEDVESVALQLLLP